ncbi:MAG: hypothetical protein RIR12_1581 [Bacteroidota bacterium]|jgi:hypothetical protein
MRFISFIKQNAAQTNPALKSFANYAAANKKFPVSSDPRVLSLYLYNKLTALETKGFQLFMILYKESEKK